MIQWIVVTRASTVHVGGCAPGMPGPCLRVLLSVRAVLGTQIKLQDQHCAEVEARLRLPEGWSVTFNCSQVWPANAAAAALHLQLSCPFLTPSPEAAM